MLDPKSDGYRFIANWAKGQNLELSVSNGASDLNKIYNYLKTKGRDVIGVHFGPGFLDLAHRSDEFTLISELEQFYGYYADYSENSSMEKESRYFNENGTPFNRMESTFP